MIVEAEFLVQISSQWLPPRSPVWFLFSANLNINNFQHLNEKWYCIKVRSNNVQIDNRLHCVAMVTYKKMVFGFLFVCFLRFFFVCTKYINIITGSPVFSFISKFRVPGLVCNHIGIMKLVVRHINFVSTRVKSKIFWFFYFWKTMLNFILD